MEYAYDPATRRNLSVDQYKEIYGPKLDKHANPRSRPILKCLACGVPLHTVAEDSPTAVPTWGHDPRPDIFCPVKMEGGGKYAILSPVEADLVAGAVLRAAFFRKWQLHWGYMRKVAPFADIVSLVKFLKEADRKNFWNQRHLAEWHLPYVFLSAYDSPPPVGKAGALRAEWLRFRFDGRYRTLQDLWIHAEADFGFLRLKYRVPARKKEPGPTEFIKAEPVVVSSDWMNDTYAPPNVFAIKKMQESFPLELL